MDTKEHLVNNIKEWLKNDTEISKLQTEIKELKNMWHEAWLSRHRYRSV